MFWHDVHWAGPFFSNFLQILLSLKWKDHIEMNDDVWYIPGIGTYFYNHHVNHSGILDMCVGHEFLPQLCFCLNFIHRNIKFWHHKWQLTAPSFVQGQNAQPCFIIVNWQQRLHLKKNLIKLTFAHTVIQKKKPPKRVLKVFSDRNHLGLECTCLNTWTPLALAAIFIYFDDQLRIMM